VHSPFRGCCCCCSSVAHQMGGHNMIYPHFEPATFTSELLCTQACAACHHLHCWSVCEFRIRVARAGQFRQQNQPTSGKQARMHCNVIKHAQMLRHPVQVFRRATGSLFRWLHFSSEFAGETDHAMKVLRLCFALPDADDMTKLDPCAFPFNSRIQPCKHASYAAEVA
jgi:hypothetical protein